ncbi:MAG TPA: hypothetical protein ENF73_05905 [Proteobacteria bacterium]|nr:hypothetical protein [Pseudomonadota bacterium]
MAEAYVSGLASGLDTDQIISQLMAIERRPVVRLQNKVSAYQDAISMYDELASKFRSLRTAARALDSFWEFCVKQATSSDEDVLTATASYAADVQSHTITVQQLARAESEVSQGYSSTSDSVGTGTVVITVGDDDPVTITLTEGNDTLEDLKDAINASDADVTASIINDGDASNPYRLVVTSNQTGASRSITIDTSGLSGGTTPVFTDGDPGEAGQKAQDAILIVDGITVTKSENTITDLFEGVTIQLHQTSTEQVELEIESDIDTLKENIRSFVSAFNEFLDFLESAKDNPDYATERSTLLQLELSLKGAFTSSIEGLSGTYQHLSQVGLRFDENGELTFDEDDFDDAIEDDFEGVMKLFVGFGETSHSAVEFVGLTDETEAGTYSVEITEVGDTYVRGKINGHDAVSSGTSQLIGAEGYPEEGLLIHFEGSTPGTYGTVTVTIGAMELIERRLSQLLDVEDGLIAIKKNSLQSHINQLEMTIDRREQALNRVEQRYRRQFAQMESMLSGLQTQSLFISSSSLLLYSLVKR